MVRPARRLPVYCGLALATLLAAFPIVWMALMSIRSNSEIFAAPPTILPRKIIFDSYLTILTTPEHLRFFLNSYLVAAVVTLASIVIAVLAGYGFSRFQFKGKKVLNLFVIMTQTIPPITLLIPFFGLVVAFGLYDTYTALVLSYLTLTLPYAILMMTAYFNTVSTEMDEAVLTDGGSRFYALWRVILPLSVPGIIAVGVYTFLLSWNEFLFALTLTKRTSLRTIPVGIALFMGQHAYEWNTMMAMSILGTGPILVLYMLAQRFFLSGLTAGASKG